MGVTRASRAQVPQAAADGAKHRAGGWHGGRRRARVQVGLDHRPRRHRHRVQHQPHVAIRQCAMPCLGSTACFMIGTEALTENPLRFYSLHLRARCLGSEETAGAARSGCDVHVEPGARGGLSGAGRLGGPRARQSFRLRSGRACTAAVPSQQLCCGVAAGMGASGSRCVSGRLLRVAASWMVILVDAWERAPACVSGAR